MAVNSISVIDLCELCGIFIETILTHFEAITPKTLKGHQALIGKYKFTILYYLYTLQRENLANINKTFRDYSGLKIPELMGLTCLTNKPDHNIKPKVLFNWNNPELGVLKEVSPKRLEQLLFIVIDNGFAHLHSQIKLKKFGNVETSKISLEVMTKLKRELKMIVSATKQKLPKIVESDIKFVQITIQTTEI
jgi:hypothetical protein